MPNKIINTQHHHFNLDDNQFLLKHANLPQIFSQEIINFLEKQIHPYPPKKEFRFLDIGCGTGKLSMQLIQYFQKHFVTSAHLLDPLSSAIVLAQKHNQAKTASKSIHPSTKLSFFKSKFEDFPISAIHNDSLKYDFILCSHVFYYFENWETIIEKCNTLLNSNGLLCILLKDDRGLEIFALRERILTHLNFEVEDNLQVACQLNKTLNQMIHLDHTNLSFNYNVRLSRQNSKNVFLDTVRILRYIFHFPINSFLHDKHVVCLIKDFIKTHTLGDNVIIPMKDLFFFLQPKR